MVRLEIVRVTGNECECPSSRGVDREARTRHFAGLSANTAHSEAASLVIGSDDEQIRLLDIALLKEFQNRGIGTILLRRLMAEAADAQKVLRHMVFTLNSDAHRFYERLGFVVIEDLGAYKHMEWRANIT